MRNFKRLIAGFLLAVMCMQSIPAYATGDPNIDSGGGDMQDGQKENFWYSGNDGVRVTIVDAETGQPKSATIDYTNKDCSDIAIHFGQVSKASYVGGTGLSVHNGGYSYKKPAQPLPTIISNGDWLTADIEEIRSYFTDEQVIRAIAGDMGFKFDDLVNGDYKLMVEPVAYITYNGVRTALSATEAALYNMKTGGDLINKFAPLSHKNLPLAMFLEEDDLGYKAWTGSTESRATDSDIINYLGVGIITFKEKETDVDIDASDYDYRIDTDVYTSITVSGGKHTPDNPVKVVFTIKNRRYTVDNIVYPAGGSQLVWVRWHTPTTEQVVDIKVDVYGGANASKTNIKANIVDLDKNPPPNPTAYDRNDTFRAASVPNKQQKTSASWSVWGAHWKAKWVWVPKWTWNGKRWVDKGKWVDKGEWKFSGSSYSVSLTANMKISCDEKNPTASGRTMKSGYGINQVVTSTIRGSGEHTEAQNAVAYFPEFKYKTYWRLLERTSSGKMEFRKNKYSTYNNRTHFTPVWYPDGTYTAYTWVIDCWTPAGMLSMNCTDSLTIKGNVFDDWHIGATRS